MPASLITLIGPNPHPEFTSALPSALNARAGSDVVGALKPFAAPHTSALAGLHTHQWVSDLPVAQLRKHLVDLQSQAHGQGLDLLITPGHLLSPGPRLFVTDVDSTLIQDEVIELLAEHAGTRQQVAEVTEAAMRGELDFTQSLIQRVATLRGVDQQVHAQVLESLRLSAGVENLCRTAKANGDYVGVVSGGFIEVVQPLADRLGIDFARANTLEVAGGKLTGAVTGRVIDREVKAETLRDWAHQCSVPIERTIAIGDGANDLSMLAAAGLGVAFNAKPVVAQQADIAITGRRLDVILAVIGN